MTFLPPRLRVGLQLVPVLVLSTIRFLTYLTYIAPSAAGLSTPVPAWEHTPSRALFAWKSIAFILKAERHFCPI